MAANSARSSKPTLPVHGASVLPNIIVDSYNCEFEDEDGFIGDKASKSAFNDLLDNARKLAGEDPFGKKGSEEIGKKKLSEVLAEGEAEAAAVVQSAIEEFAKQLAGVIRRFLRVKAWRDTGCIVIGGGFRAGRIGELAVARTGILLRKEDLSVELQLIHNDPDEAGLIGATHLLPPWMLHGHEGMLAVDVGGSNIRAGIVELNLKGVSDLSKAQVLEMKSWRHKDDDLGRDDAIGYLTDMLAELVKRAKKDKVSLVPVVGIRVSCEMLDGSHPKVLSSSVYGD